MGKCKECKGQNCSSYNVCDCVDCIDNECQGCGGLCQDCACYDCNPNNINNNTDKFYELRDIVNL